MRSGLGNNFDQLLRVPLGAWSPNSIGAALVGEFDILQKVYKDAGTTLSADTENVYRWTSLNDPAVYWERSVTGDQPTLQTVSGFKACFFASNDILLLNGHAPLWNASGSSVAFWVRAGAAGGGTFYAESDNAGTSPWLTIRDGSTTKVNVFHRDDSVATQINATSTADAFNSSWHHVCVTDSGGVCKTYIDGALDNTATTYTKGTTTLDTVSLGSSFRSAAIGVSSNAYIGRRVVLASRVLTATEVALLYAYG